MPFFLIGGVIGLVGGFTGSGAVKETASATKYVSVAVISYVAYQFFKNVKGLR